MIYRDPVSDIKMPEGVHENSCFFFKHDYEKRTEVKQTVIP
jgi:hypothetical protein